MSNIDLALYAKRLKIPNFRGVYMIDSLPSKPLFRERIIINLDSSENEGTHWVAVKKDGDIAFYFDSFGNLKPPKEIEHYLAGVQIMYNTRRFQSFSSVICGHWCLQFLSQ